MLNTCSVRAKPEQKVKSKLGEIRLIKENRPELIVGVCGCMAQRHGDSLRKRAPFIDLVVGTAQVSSIPEMICEVLRVRHPVTALDLPRKETDTAAVPNRTKQTDIGLKAFVPITYGCDNFCAYCIVPYVRGKERSRPVGDVLAEVRELVDSGTKEITLLGQNVNSYASEEPNADFPDLLAVLNDVEGLERIRFTTSHPKDMSDRLIEAIAKLAKVCEHIHLPMQAGDTETLKRMRRGYTVERYLERVESLRKAVPNNAITTDILIGFAGETEAEFENTLKTIEQVQFDAAFMFAFNPIAGTVGATLPNQLTTEEKNIRLAKVIAIQNRITIEKNQRQVGSVFEVLVEGWSPKNQRRVTGLTRENKTVNFVATEDVIGSLVRVQALEGHLYGFLGEMAE